MLPLETYHITQMNSQDGENIGLHIGFCIDRLYCASFYASFYVVSRISYLVTIIMIVTKIG